MFKGIFYIFLFVMVFGYFMSQDDDKSDKKVSTKIETKKTTNSTPKINQVGRNNLVKQYTDPGYVESSFPTSSSFWIMIKDPPNPADAYAKIVCKQAKQDYNTKGFTITIWKLGTQKKYGMARCY